MQFSITVETPVGDAINLLSGTMNPQLVPVFALKFAEVKRYIPQLNLVINGHTLTQLIFERGNVRLQGLPVHWISTIGEG